MMYPAAPIGTIPGVGGYFDGTADPDNTSRPLYGAGFGSSVKRFFKQYADFTGRTSRSEFWWTALFLGLGNFVLFMLYGIGLSIADTASYGGGSAYALAFIGGALLFIFSLGTLIPGIALTWRRLHDANMAGPFFFLSMIPYLGWIALLVFGVLPSKSEGRRFDQQVR